MARTRRSKSTTPEWRVISGGLTLLDKRSFNKGDVFEAEEHEISEAFRDLVQRITPVEKKVIKKEPKYFLREVVATATEQDKEDYVQLYEIIDKKDKVITDKPVTKEEVKVLLMDMNA